VQRHRPITRTKENPGRAISRDGYIFLYWYVRGEDGYTAKRSQMEHRRIWEQAHGAIRAGEIIHHVNGDKQDNRLANLEIMTRGEHSRLHGRAMSDETRAKIRKWHTGRKRSDEVCQHMRESALGNKWALGHKVSAEARAKMSEAAKRQWADPEARERTINGRWPDRGKEYI